MMSIELQVRRFAQQLNDDGLTVKHIFIHESHRVGMPPNIYGAELHYNPLMAIGEDEIHPGIDLKENSCVIFAADETPLVRMFMYTLDLSSEANS